VHQHRIEDDAFDRFPDIGRVFPSKAMVDDVTAVFEAATLSVMPNVHGSTQTLVMSDFGRRLNKKYVDEMLSKGGTPQILASQDRRRVISAYWPDGSSAVVMPMND
jgi:hypothetical protein